MSQESTYRPAILPSEAVMMPAEEVADAPLPAAQDEISPNDPSMTPARSRKTSFSLERIRNRNRIDPGATWYSTSQMPIDRTTEAPRRTGPQQPGAAQQTVRQEPQPPGTFSQGAALATLMRSATRQMQPAPVLRQPAPAVQTSTPQQPQMRGALRGVVRQAQQPSPQGAARLPGQRSE